MSKHTVIVEYFMNNMLSFQMSLYWQNNEICELFSFLKIKVEQIW